MRDTILEKCILCPRACGVNRLKGQKGYCRETAKIMAARAALHRWEEPCISGKRGSGAVFFSGCSLGCLFCQNREIARAEAQKEISVKRLAEIFLELQQQGAANINLVTAGHFVPQILDALDEARKSGLIIPVVYNSSGYEKAETIRMLEGYVDIFLPDFKYWEPALAKRYALAEDYPVYAKEAIQEMVRQTGECQFDEEGYIRRGTIVRHLILPGNIRNSKKILRYLSDTYQDQIYISIMNQYTPVHPVDIYPELNRKVTSREYERVLDFAVELGIEKGYIQEGDTASESFIPIFDFEGLEKKVLE